MSEKDYNRQVVKRQRIGRETLVVEVETINQRGQIFNCDKIEK